MKSINITSCIFRKINLIRIEVTSSGIGRKEIAMVYFRRGKVDIREFRDFETQTLSKWKNIPVLLWVVGDQVISKKYLKDDPMLKKITSNSELLLDMEIRNNGEQVLSFLRKDKLSEDLQIVEKHRLPLIDIWIYDSMLNLSDIRSRLGLLYKEKFRSSALFRETGFKNKIAEMLFQRLFFPILLLAFGLLLGNFFIYSYLTKQNQQRQSIILQNRKEKQVSSTEQQKESLFFAAYEQIPDHSFALLADRIASYIPVNLYLNYLEMFPVTQKAGGKNKNGLSIKYDTIHLKGVVETPGAITLLSQFLESDNLFNKVRVVRLERLKKSDTFEFELEIIL